MMMQITTNTVEISSAGVSRPVTSRQWMSATTASMKPSSAANGRTVVLSVLTFGPFGRGATEEPRDLFPMEQGLARVVERPQRVHWAARELVDLIGVDAKVFRSFTDREDEKW